MDHQVEHDVDVEAAGRERAEAMDLDEPGLEGRLAQRVDGRIEPLDVPDLQDRPLLAGQPDQVLRLRQTGRHRLLDEDVLARFEQRPGHPVVFHGGDRN